MTKLIIVESPGKLKSIQSYLGPDFTVAASVGHIRDLPTNELGVEPPEYRPKYQPTDRGKDVITRLKKLTATATQIYLCTDPDREGESIAWHLQQVLQLKSPLRATFSEITEKAVKAAIANPRKIDTALVTAQEARRVLDRLVGFIVSNELSIKAQQKLSAGRVQSPAVRLVVERERTIENFKVTTHYGATLKFTNNGEWTAEWNTKIEFPQAPHYCLDKTIAEKATTTQPVTVASYTETTKKRAPKSALTTSLLQQAASVTLKINPDVTMTLAQSLYEKGVITYHRTDNPNVSPDSYEKIKKWALTAHIPIAPEYRAFKLKNGAQAAHSAIQPTHYETETAGDTDAEKALYDLIRRRAIASQLADATYATKHTILKSNTGQEFIAQSRTLIDTGWLKFAEHLNDNDDEKNEPETINNIPALQPGQQLTPATASIFTAKTKAPGRYTRASLTKALEDEGIGRPSTYAAITTRIETAEYVTEQKQQLFPTKRAYTLIDALVGQCEFIELDFTRSMETKLDDLAAGKGSYRTMMDDTYQQLKKEMSTFTVAGVEIYPCPSCNNPLKKITLKTNTFWGCSNHPICTTSLPDNDGKPGQAKPKSPLSNYRCTCGKQLILREKDGIKPYKFWACSGYPKCKKSYNDNDGKPKIDIDIEKSKNK